MRKYKGSIEFKLDDNVLEGITKQSDGRYVVEIKNIPADKLSEMHEITVTTDNGAATVRVSALSYAKALLDAYASDPLAVNAAVAFCRYSKFADVLAN